MESRSGRYRNFVLLEVGRGNLGRGAPRVPAERLCASWNRRLVSVPVGPQVSRGYGHTGNYMLECAMPLAIPELAGLLHDRLRRCFALFPISDYCNWVDELTAALVQAPEPQHGRRATPGAVMDVNPLGGIPGFPAASVRIGFSNWAIPRVRGAWKYDILRSDGKALDSKKREGGWGAVAAAMVAHAGGRWTARALSTLRGLAQAAGSQDT
jgi:hypothetical protein